LYPNPTEKNIFINIKNPSFSKLQLQLFNMQGQLLLQQELNTPGKDELFQIAINHLPKANYIVQLQAPDFKLTKKIVKL
jgi:hypothetical protein